MVYKRNCNLHVPFIIRITDLYVRDFVSVSIEKYVEYCKVIFPLLYLLSAYTMVKVGNTIFPVQLLKVMFCPANCKPHSSLNYPVFFQSTFQDRNELLVENLNLGQLYYIDWDRDKSDNEASVLVSQRDFLDNRLACVWIIRKCPNFLSMIKILYLSDAIPASRPSYFTLRRRSCKESLSCVLCLNCVHAYKFGYVSEPTKLCLCL